MQYTETYMILVCSTNHFFGCAVSNLDSEVKMVTTQHRF